jgi:type IV pilus assembly protein PilE
MHRQAGFTLLELMVVVVVIAILAAVGYPSYTDYTRRGKIAEAVATLANYRAQMEQYFLDNRSYRDAGGACGVVAPTAPAVKYFTYACAAPDATSYTVTATGNGGEGMGPFVYTINQQNVRTSTVTGLSGWSGSTNCWVTKKGGAC